MEAWGRKGWLAAAILSMATATAGLPGQDADEVRAKLAKHDFFRRVDFEIVSDYPPFLFVVERPKKDDPEYAMRTVRVFVSFLRTLHDVFEKEYAHPLQLERRPDVTTYTIAILASKGSYRDYAQAVQSYGLEFARAHFDPELRVAVTYEDYFGGPADPKTRIQPLLHEFVHALQHAYYRGDGDMPKPQWFNEGVAEYRSVTRNVARFLEDPDIHPQHLRVVALLLMDARLRAFLSPLEELLDIDGPGYAQVIQKAAARAGIAQPDERFQQLALGAFYAQSTILSYFLHKGENARYRLAFGSYFAKVMNGERGAEAFAAAFRAISLEELQQRFVAFVRSEMRKRNLEPAALDQITYGGEGLAGADPAQAAIEMPTFDYARLGWRDGDWQLRAAAAIGAAREGELGAAIAALEAIPSEHDDVKARLARETGRLKRLLEFRSEAFRALRESGKLVALELDGKKVRGRIQSFDDERFLLVFGRLERDLPLDAFGWEDLFTELRKKDALDRDNAWVEHYTRALAGENVAADLGRTGEEGALRKDLGSLRDWREQAAAARAWQALATMGEPADRAAAGEAFAAIEQIVAEAGDSDLFAARREDLEDLIRDLVHRSFDPGRPESLGLAGEVTSLGGDRIRVTYDFSDADQVADFAAGKDELPTLRQLLPASPRAASVAIDDEKLQLVGDACFRYALPFDAPFELSYRVAVSGTDTVAMVGFCADGLGNMILTDVDGSLRVIDQQSGIAGDIESKAGTLYVDRVYDVKIVHDGKTVTTMLEGKPVAKADRIGTRTSGTLFFWVHAGDPVQLHELTIEGTVEPAAARAALEAHAEREIGRLLK